MTGRMSRGEAFPDVRFSPAGATSVCPAGGLRSDYSAGQFFITGQMPGGECLASTWRLTVVPVWRNMAA